MINLYKDYYIDADENNFVLKKKIFGKTKTGEERETFRPEGYFASMSGLYAFFVREVEKEVISSESVTTIHDFIEKMNDVIEELKYFTKRLEDIEALKQADYDEDD